MSGFRPFERRRSSGRPEVSESDVGPGFPANFSRRLTYRSSTSNDSTLLPSPPAQGRRLSFHQRFDKGIGPLGLSCVHSPAEPLVDLILVHGLHGGSYKTWRKNEEVGSFWPGEWLPKDPDFERVRIHTFGYNSDWKNFKDNHANVEEFGSALHGSMVSSTFLNRGEKTPIIMMGHSMGGLVIKRAVLMFRRADQAGYDPHTSDLAGRMKCLMFLATPHHGSNSAEKLDKILRVALNPIPHKDYVKDLRRESLSNQQINDDFRFIAEDYDIYSFYETRQMPVIGMVVEKDSACIGYRREHTQPMDADHRSICKFETADDPNYHNIRDHLAIVIDDLIQQESDSESEQVEDLSVYLDCEEAQDDDIYESTLERKMSGTCEWITQRPNFIPWMQERGLHFWLYWLHAPPGTGKSMISASVVDYLFSQQRDVVHFFFSDGDKYHRTVAGLLRFIALQLAEKHPTVHHAIREMQREGIKWDEMDERAIWKKLFIARIFKMPLNKNQFWVIDALDECSDALKFFPLLHMLKTPHRAWPLRIFVTSRPPTGRLIELAPQARKASDLGLRCTEDRITNDDTESDIRLLMKKNEPYIPITDDKERADFLNKIIHRAQGSFLWAGIVLKEIRDAYSIEDLDRILEEVPMDMVPYYENIFANMSRAEPRKKPLIQAILTWVVSGNRPLSEAELQMGLKLHLNVNIVGMRRTIEQLCGQIIVMDKRGTIRIIHATAREFLLSAEHDSEYCVRREEGHATLAKTCLQYLAGEEMRSKRALTGYVSTARKQTITDRVSAFADYASTAFTYHLINSHSDDDELFNLLAKFLQSSNVLSWIEYVALKHHSLEHIKEAGTNIRRYMKRRLKHVAPLGSQHETVDGWSLDLLRIVSKYGRDILDAPSDFMRLVPPMCPQESQIHKQFARRNPNFYVTGLAEQHWADAISYIEHDYSGHSARPRCIASGPQYFAIGEHNATGSIRVFSLDTCQECAFLMHGEPVDNIVFNNAGKDLITSGQTSIKYWDLSNISSPTEVWLRDVKHNCLGFFFADDDERLLAATGDRRLLNVSLDTEEDEGITSLTSGQLKLPHGLRTMGKDDAVVSKSQISFSADGTTIAFVCLNQTVAIWSVDDGHFIGVCEPDTRTGGIHNILLNPNPDIQFLVMSHGSSNMTLFDYENFMKTKSVEADCVAMASTADGQTLATADSLGDIELWDFGTLVKIYKIKYRSSVVQDLTFSKDGLRLMDTRETHSVVWEPAALIRGNEEDGDISTTARSVSQRLVDETDNHEDPVEITALAHCGSSDYALVGKDDGTVSLYDLKDGQTVGLLCTITESVPVTQLVYHESGLFAASNTANKVVVAVCDVSQGSRVRPIFIAAAIEGFNSTIQQLMWVDDGPRLFVGSSDRIQTWEVSLGGGDVAAAKLVLDRQPEYGENWRAFSSASSRSGFQIIDKGISHFMTQEPQRMRLRLRRSNSNDSHNQQTHIRCAFVDPQTGYLIVEYGRKSTTQLVVLEKLDLATHESESDKLSPSTTPATVSTEKYQLLLHLGPNQVKMFLGLHDGRLFYVANHLWVKSVNLQSLDGFTTSHDVEKDKHFFIPREYIGGNHNVQAVVGNHGEIMFPRRGELAVVWGGLEQRYGV